MRNYRPILLQEVAVRLPGVRLRRLRLHRHLPEVDALAPHHHRFSQVLCYLRGSGRLTIGNRTRDVATGTVVFLPPGVVHAFQEVPGRRPLCLVVDLDWRGAAAVGPQVARLWQSESGAVRRELSALAGLPDPASPACRLVAGAAVLRATDILLRSLRILPSLVRETPSFVRQFDRLLRQSLPDRPSIRELATRAGYQPDYLNRIFRTATGQTLREYRDTLLVARAESLLRRGQRVGAVAASVGFPDQNYFARWFRQQTGRRPRDVAGASDGAPGSRPSNASAPRRAPR